MTASHELDLSATPPELYERHFTPRLFTPWAHQLVALAGLQPGDRALDVACGTGAATRLLVEHVGTGGAVVGLDVNAGMLAVARSVVTDARVTWREASAVDLPFADDSFDVVICQQGLQFFPDRPRALQEMRRVLAPGGRLILACWGSSSESPGYAAVEQALTPHVGAAQAKLPPFGLGDRAVFRGLIEGAGFRETEIRDAVGTVSWPSADFFVRATAASAPTMLGSLAEQGDAVLAQVITEVEAALEAHRGGEGVIFPMSNQIAIARV
jgi:SAM-dependent methyltransferase